MMTADDVASRPLLMMRHGRCRRWLMLTWSVAVRARATWQVSLASSSPSLCASPAGASSATCSTTIRPTYTSFSQTHPPELTLAHALSTPSLPSLSHRACVCVMRGVWVGVWVVWGGGAGAYARAFCAVLCAALQPGPRAAPRSLVGDATRRLRRARVRGEHARGTCLMT
jgi:hypothetical protein